MFRSGVLNTTLTLVLMLVFVASASCDLIRFPDRDTVNVQQGGEVTLECRVPSGQPTDGSFTWSGPQVAFDSGHAVIVRSDHRRSHLRIRNAGPGDEGTYRCLYSSGEEAHFNVIVQRNPLPLQVTEDFPATVDGILGELANFSCSITGTNVSSHWKVDGVIYNDCNDTVFCVNSQMISETLQETVLTIYTTGVPLDTPLRVECVGVQELESTSTRSRPTLFTVRAIRLSVLSRIDNVVELVCRRSDGGTLSSPLFRRSSGTELQGEMVGAGEFLITITEHSIVICQDGNQLSNRIRLPAFPSMTPPPSEVHEFRGSVAELLCTIDPGPSEDFKDLYSVEQWVRAPKNGSQLQSFTPQSLPLGNHLSIDAATFSFFVRVGERIGERVRCGDIYKCEFNIREWSSSDGEVGDNVLFEGENITIAVEDPTTGVNSIAAGVTVGILILLLVILMAALGIILCKLKIKKSNESLIELRVNQAYAHSLNGANAVETCLSSTPLERVPTYESIKDVYTELVHIYDEPQPQFHEHAELHVQSHQLSQGPQPHEQPDGSCEQPPQSSSGGDTSRPGCGQTDSLEQSSERQSSSLELFDRSYRPPDRWSLNHDSHVDQQSPNQKPSKTQSSSPVPPDDHEEAQREKPDGYERVQEYEKPDGYERVQEYEKPDGYERVQEYERLGGDEHCRIQDDYENCQEYEKLQDYEQIQEYERLGEEEQHYKLDDYECYEIPDGYERVQEYERIGSI